MQINLLFGTPCINLFLAPTGARGVVFLPATAYYAQQGSKWGCWKHWKASQKELKGELKTKHDSCIDHIGYSIIVYQTVTTEIKKNQ